MRMLTSAAGCLNMETRVLSEISLARALVYDTEIVKQRCTFVDEDRDEFLERLVDEGWRNVVTADGWG